jgi:anaerobic selenocysteine-containing dehydrogenase
MHNVPTLVRGSNRCTLKLSPEDAQRLGLADGDTARISSRVGAIEAPVEVSDEMMPGVVSLPHGWGHGAPGIQMSVAAKNAGVSVNDLTDETVIDPLSGNAVLNAVPVEVSPQRKVNL